MAHYTRLIAVSPPGVMGTAEVNPFSDNFSMDAALECIAFHVDTYLHFLRRAAERGADLIVSPETIDPRSALC